MKFSFERTLAEGQAGFAGLLEAVEAYLEVQSVPPAVAAQLMIVFDEVISNVFNHASLSGEPIVFVGIDVGSDSAVGEIADNGAAFDPLSLPEPDTTLAAEDRALGGLGIHIVRNIMDEVEYSRRNGWNRLRFSKVFPLEGP